MNSIFKILLFTIFVTGLAFSAKTPHPVKTKTDTIISQTTIGFDTLALKTLAQKFETKSVENKWEKRWPWVFASGVGLLSLIVNLTAGWLQRKTSLDIASKQIRSALISGSWDKWHINLREKLSRFRTVMGRLHLDFDPRHHLQLTPAERDLLVFEAEELSHNIRLLLKPNEHLTKKDDLEKRILELIPIIMQINGVLQGVNVVQRQDLAVQVSQHLVEFVDVSCKFLKKEWDEVRERL